jgi:stringent starvation protein B
MTTSSRPYLIRALYEWINDNGLTPYIVVNTQLQNVAVPKKYISDGKIVLNISSDAACDLAISNREMEFYASFSGISYHLVIPIEAVMVIYAQENGLGMVFGDEPGGDSPPDSKYSKKEKQPAKKRHLKIIKP